ncbi:hypothetical protein K493DRAFT_314397 [Basidiobolus meristosporus CBS 931.73]|uniref:Fork-head domain-containing protein n=1 Tax=Basidiobolus meristosporus CBS 931.73 TaxID=1314790 RepID=A0A1Y1YFI8_9FUNG|nr:hypothetical protein K493DRAFT_314397 [Basidiobolus meristosporus CBS 931.73]|eukprot:ORX96663.1 hypothetical protein K493DRAFT_314397 [Basidiobolus meristosporus CBS 931.73]
MVISSGTPVRVTEATPNFQRVLGTPPKFRLTRPNESWSKIVESAVAISSKASFSVRDIYQYVIEVYPHYKLEDTESVLQNINTVLRSSELYNPLGEPDRWAISEAFRNVVSKTEPCSEPGSVPNFLKIPSPFAATREPNILLRPLIPNSRQILPPLDSFGPPKLAPLLPFSPPFHNGRKFPGLTKEPASKMHSGFSPVRSHSNVCDVFSQAASGSDTEDEDWKSIGPTALCGRKHASSCPSIPRESATRSKRLETGTLFPPTPISPMPQKSDNLAITPKESPPVDDEDTDDENWAQMDITPKRKSSYTPLESHTPIKKALNDISHAEEQLSTDKRIALEALALLCSPSRDRIPTDAERHKDVRQTPIHL